MQIIPQFIQGKQNELVNKYLLNKGENIIKLVIKNILNFNLNEQSFLFAFNLFSYLSI